MIILAAFKIAFTGLRRNLLRSLLTMLGIIFGVAAVIAVVSLGNGAKAQVEKQISTLGQNVVMVMSGAASRGGFRMAFGTAGTLTLGDFDSIRKEVEGVAGVSPEVRSFAQVAVGNQNANPQIMGVGSDYADIRTWRFASGDNFTEADVRNANKVALIGKTTATQLFGGEDPVGQILRVKNAPFRIVGLLAPKGVNMMGSDQDDVVLVPYTSAMKRLTGDTTFRSLLVQATEPTLLTSVQGQITEILRQRHRIQPGRDDDFLVRTQQEISEFATETSRVLTLLLGGVAGVSLVVGGIGIMNIMLVSVTERTREIGLRLAVGARGRDILLQFLIEALTLSVVGGLLGIGLGWWASDWLSGMMQSPTLIAANSVALAFGSAAMIGIVFGFFPAMKASQLDPIEALRYE
ncbi:MAG: Macrolide export ATP-binding/permease protein MacB [Verrucomicrobiota bacterium]|jgi:putative ABC transport system permease protein